MFLLLGWQCLYLLSDKAAKWGVYLDKLVMSQQNPKLDKYQVEITKMLVIISQSVTTAASCHNVSRSLTAFVGTVRALVIFKAMLQSKTLSAKAFHSNLMHRYKLQSSNERPFCDHSEIALKSLWHRWLCHKCSKLRQLLLCRNVINLYR